MTKAFELSDFLKLFPSDEACLEEIKKLRYPKGIFCPQCKKNTKHYKVRQRTAYSCEYCRNHTYLLAQTIFEKSTTPLRLWFYAMFLMTYTRADISIRQLQQELGVTYKTAWRIYQSIKILMQQNNGDLLEKSQEVLKWTFFNAFEFKVIQKQESSD